MMPKPYWKNRKTLNSRRADRVSAGFSLLELMIVVVIIGLVSAFAIPNFNRNQERAHLRDALDQLILIHAAEQAYFARNNQYWPAPGVNADLNAINTTLQLNINANGMTYQCTGVNGTPPTFSCTAVRQGTNSFTVTLTSDPLSATNPQCTAGACP